MPRHRWSNSDAGTCTSRISSVIAIAKTPSLNASIRLVLQWLVTVCRGARGESVGPRRDVACRVDADDHPLARPLEHRSVRALALERPSLRRPAGDRTVKAPPTFVVRDRGRSAAVPCGEERDRGDEGDGQDREKHPDPV